MQHLSHQPSMIQHRTSQAVLRHVSLQFGSTVDTEIETNHMSLARRRIPKVEGAWGRGFLFKQETFSSTWQCQKTLVRASVKGRPDSQKGVCLSSLRGTLVMSFISLNLLPVVREPSACGCGTTAPDPWSTTFACTNARGDHDGSSTSCPKTLQYGHWAGKRDPRSVLPQGPGGLNCYSPALQPGH